MEDEFLFLLVIAHDHDVRIYLQESDVIREGRQIDVRSLFHICCDKHLIVSLSCEIIASVQKDNGNRNSNTCYNSCSHSKKYQHFKKVHISYQMY